MSDNAKILGRIELPKEFKPRKIKSERETIQELFNRIPMEAYYGTGESK